MPCSALSFLLLPIILLLRGRRPGRVKWLSMFLGNRTLRFWLRLFRTPWSWLPWQLGDTRNLRFEVANSVLTWKNVTCVVLKQACWLCNSFQHIPCWWWVLTDILWALLLLKTTLKMPWQAQDGNMNTWSSPCWTRKWLFVILLEEDGKNKNYSHDS